MAHKLTIHLLGEIVICLEEERITDQLSDKEQALLIYLACSPRPYAREAMATLLWDERSQKQALANLRGLLSKMDPKVKPHLAITRQTVAFEKGHGYWLDTAVFEQQIGPVLKRLDAAEPVDETVAGQLQQALAHYRGDFLSDFHPQESRGFEEWAALERERLRYLAIAALHRLVTYYLDNGRYESGLPAAARLLELDPYSEAAHRHRMLLLARTGQREAALAQYEICRDLLAKEFNVAPTAVTSELYLQLQAISEVGNHNLPPQSFPLAGREAELQGLCKLLTNPACRLITLVGPAGSGKMAVALQAAKANRMSFLHGVYLVPLSQAQTLLTAVAGTLPFYLDNHRPLTEQVLAALCPREVLLVLDGCEHLRPEARGLLADILRAAPRVKLLVTSPERLYLLSEWVFDIEKSTAIQPDAQAPA